MQMIDWAKARQRLAALSFVCATGFSFGAPDDVSAADAARGGTIAARWCASCHLIQPDQKTTTVDAPTFSAIARKTNSTATLKAFLADPHPKMPDMNLTTSEIGDLTAYIAAQQH